MKKFNIDEYLNFAERKYSGANGYSELDEEYEMSFDGSLPQAKQVVVRPSKPAAPIVLNVSNPTTGILNAKLFGHNKYLLSTNFGSDVGISVTNANVGVSYLQTLIETSSTPYMFGSTRLTSGTFTQLTQPWLLEQFASNGQSLTNPIITSTYFSPAQYQNGILDLPVPITIDGNTSISFPVLGGAAITLSFFPESKVNVANQLNGESVLRQYALPATAVGQPVFVSPRTVRSLNA